MSTATQQTEVRTVYATCRLGKSELARLFALAPEGIPANDVQISTQRDSTRYSSGTFSDLVNHVSGSTASGNLAKWDNLQLDASDSAGDRKVILKLDKQRVEVQVAGADATWVHGQAARIELLLEGAGGSRAVENATKALAKRLGLFLVAAIPLFAAWAVAFSFIIVPLAEDDPSLVGPSFMKAASVLLLTMAGYAAVFKLLANVNKALLLPTAEVPHGSWWSRASNGDKIGLATLAVAFLALIVAALTLGKDILK
ncbi:hypothetical protein [Streptomyces hydrogenans]